MQSKKIPDHDSEGCTLKDHEVQAASFSSTSCPPLDESQQEGKWEVKEKGQEEMDQEKKLVKKKSKIQEVTEDLRTEHSEEPEVEKREQA
jgi:hypothetical protein